MFLSALAQKQSSEDKEQLSQPLFLGISLLSGSSLLSPMTIAQRQFFFNSIMRMLQMQSAENEARTRALAPKVLPQASSISMLIRKSGKGKEKQRKIYEEKKRQVDAELESARAQVEMEIIQAARVISPAKGGKPARAAPAPYDKEQHFGSLMPDSGIMGPPQLSKAEQKVDEEKGNMLRRIVFKKDAAKVKEIQKELFAVLSDYSRGDVQMAEDALAESSKRLESQNFKAEGLMAELLLVIEDKTHAAEEGDIDGARPGGSASKVLASLPEKMRNAAEQSLQVRLASVREMLHYYFLRHPMEYDKMVALALGMSEAEAGDSESLREKIAAELSSIGSAALSEKILSAIKMKKKMDDNACLLELGYKFDKEKKVLIVGKRTCLKPSDARRMIAALASKFKRPKK